MDTQDIECPLIRETVQEEESKNKKNEILEEMKRLLLLAGPLMTVNFLLYCLQVISIMFVGHLGELALSGASMATSFASVTGLSLMMGMGSALDTLCGQSYGAKQYHMLGIHMQRAMLVLLLASVPLACIWANAGHILVLFGQDPEISAEAGSYARYMIPTIFAFALLQCHIRFLQTQNNVIPMMFSAGITTLLHIFTCWILVFKSGLGNKGAALANAISYWINLLLLAGYVRISPSCKNTWAGFSKEAFHDIWKYMRLAIPSAVMLCLEIWSFEMMVLLSGLLPNPKLETLVLSISLNTCAMVYMIPLGLSGATTVRVSNELGAGRPQAARLAASTALLLVATEGVVAAIVLISVRKLWGYCYSTEEEVVEYVAEMLVLIAGSHFLDGIQSVLSGSSNILQYEFPVAVFQESGLRFFDLFKTRLEEAIGRYCARVWMAKDRGSCQLGSLLPFRNTCWCYISFCLPYRWRGTMVGYHSCPFCTSTTSFCSYSADKLEKRGK